MVMIGWAMTGGLKQGKMPLRASGYTKNSKMAARAPGLQ